METLTTTDFGANLSSGAIPADENRRLYAFGNKLYRVAPAATPFFTLVSRFGRLPAPDSEFKSLEERKSWTKRYLYLLGGTALSGTNQFSKTDWTAITAGSMIDGNFEFGSDYKNTGLFSPSGQTSLLNTSGTKPLYLLQDQVLQIPVSLADHDDNDYLNAFAFLVCQVKSFEADSGNKKVCKLKCISKPTFYEKTTRDAIALGSGDVVYIGHPPPVYLVDKKATTDNVHLNVYPVNTTAASIYKQRRVKIIGNGYGLGSGYGEGFSDNLEDTYGYTQIFKNVAEMDGSTMATEFRGRKDEWIAQWENAFQAHKMDIERTGHWMTRYKTTDDAGKVVRFTQGVVDKALSSGHVFPFQEDVYDYDNFVEDWSTYTDIENGQTDNIAAFASKEMYNWLSRIGTNSFAANTISGNSSFGSFNARMSILGMKKVVGINVKQIEMEGRVLNLIRDAQLDGTHVHMLAADLRNIKYRPFIGNGKNRDTRVYPKVKSLEKDGEDIRVDLIQTDAGFDYACGETLAAWTSLS